MDEPNHAIPSRSPLPLVLGGAAIVGVVGAIVWSLQSDAASLLAAVSANLAHAEQVAEDEESALARTVARAVAAGLHVDLAAPPCPIPTPSRGEMGAAWAATDTALLDVRVARSNELRARVPGVRARLGETLNEGELRELVDDTAAMSAPLPRRWVLVHDVFERPTPAAVEVDPEAPVGGPLPARAFTPGRVRGHLLTIEGDQIVCIGRVEAESSEHLDYRRYGESDPVAGIREADLLDQAFAAGAADMRALTP